MKGVRARLLLILVGALFAAARASADTQLTQSDVQLIIAQAVTRAAVVDKEAIIAVVDREGYVLGVWDMAGNPNPDTQFLSGAIARAETAAFLSSDQNAFTSRTAGYIIQQHFPPFVENASNGPLVGVGISSVFLTRDFFTTTPGAAGFVNVTEVRGQHSDVNFAKQIPLDQTGTFDPNGPTFANLNPFSPSQTFPALTGAQSPGTYGAGIYTGPAPTFVAPIAAEPGIVASGTAGFFIGAIGTSLNDAPGGVPLYKSGELVGGIGVTGGGTPINVSTGFALIDGIVPISVINRLSEKAGLGPLEPKGLPKNQSQATPGFTEAPSTDEDVAQAGQSHYAPSHDILATNDYIGGIQLPYVGTNSSLDGLIPLGRVGVPVNGFPLQQSPPKFAYPAAEFGGVSGELRFPIRDDPMPGKIGKTARLSASEVADIIAKAAARSGITRAGIRLPVGVPARVFISVVGNPGLTGQAPPILGVFRTGEATIFSWDVAVQKARTAYFFSNNDFAESTRTVGFLAQRFYPPGINATQPGPFFGLQEALLTDQLVAALGGIPHANKYLPNEITIFPGGFPLYRNGVLIGAIGVSGDGVDQDDIIAASGCANFLPPAKIEADRFVYRGARLPYAKFPRDPSL